MDKDVPRVLKKDHTRPGDRRMLGSAPEGKDRAPTARIVKDTDTGVLIEIECECGRKCYVNCILAEPADAADPKDRAASA